MRAPDATRSANFAAGMGFALVTAVGWGLNWPVPKYLLTELPPLYLIVRRQHRDERRTCPRVRRYDRLAANYIAFVQLVSIRLWLAELWI